MSEKNGKIKEFCKFPSTPHLAVLDGMDVREDKVLSEQGREALLRHELVIEEKIDGANLGISWNTHGDRILQNRGSLLIAPYSGQWKKLPEWLAPREEVLFDSLGDRFILFGEWCYAQHSIHYTKLPDWFLGFDIYDKQTDKFFSVHRRDAMFRTLGLSSIPWFGTEITSIKKLKENFSASHYHEDSAEGVYLRLDDGDWLSQRAKLVNPTFSQALGEEHWSRYGIRPNRLASKRLPE